MKDAWTSALIVGILLLGAFYILNNQQQPAQVPTTQVCSSDTVAKVYFYNKDKYTPTADNDGWFAVRKVGETSWVTVKSGEYLEFAPGDKIEYLADYNGTNGYAVYGTYEVPCKPIDSIEVKTADFYTSGIQATFWNADGTAATPQPLGPGDIKNVQFRFTGTYKKDYGNADIGYTILNCKVNESEIDDFTIVGLEKAPTPDIIPSESGMKDYTFKFPVLESNKELKTYTVTIDAADDVDPANNIVCTLYDTNYAIDADTGDVIKGVEDNDDNNLGVDESSVAATLTILIS